MPRLLGLMGVEDLQNMIGFNMRMTDRGRDLHVSLKSWMVGGGKTAAG